MPTIKVYSWKAKIGLFALSCLLSVILTESLIRLVIHQINAPEVYRSVLDYYESDLEVENDIDRNNRFEVHPGQVQTEILAIGDSYTNGGNVTTWMSYPYQLWLDLKKEYTVRNLGVCESTSSDAYDVLNSFVSSDQFSRDKQYIVLLLTGAADKFKVRQIVDNHDGLSLSLPFISHDKITSVPWWGHLYLYKMARILAGKIKRQINDALLSIFNIQFFQSDLPLNLEPHASISKLSAQYFHQSTQCLQPGYIKCLMQVFHHPDYSSLDETFRQRLLLRALYGSKSLYNSAQVKMLIADLIELYSSYPEQLSRIELVLDLISLLELQSEYEMSSISLLIQNIFFQLNPQIAIQAMQIIDQYTATTTNKSYVQARQLAWEQIAKLTDQHPNLKIISMTYPLNFVEVNDFIKENSHRLKFTTIDLYSQFLRFEQKDQLIDDWEHATPEGYRLMSRLIAPTIIDMIQQP